MDLRIGTFFIPSVPCRVTLAVKGTGIIRIKFRRKRTTYKRFGTFGLKVVYEFRTVF